MGAEDLLALLGLVLGSYEIMDWPTLQMPLLSTLCGWFLDPHTENGDESLDHIQRSSARDEEVL